MTTAQPIPSIVTGSPSPLLSDVLPGAPVPSLTGPAPSSTAIIPPFASFDTPSNNIGIAQNLSLKTPAKARIMWIDAGANVGNLNSADKILDVVKHIQNAGLNMIVLDVKPIVGETIYPSKYAPRLTGWRGKTADPNLDVLDEMVKDAHAVNIPVYANMSTFGEGHKLVHRGLAYLHPDWQTILYEVDRSVSSSSSREPISAVDGLPTNDRTIAALSNSGQLRKNLPGYSVAILNFDARVLATYDGATLSTSLPQVPVRGSALLARGPAASWILRNAKVGSILKFEASPRYVNVENAPEQVYTMFCNPLNADMQQHEIDMAREIATNYSVDGVVFDDRMRFAGLNADFSLQSRAAFEKVIGKPITWPDDVFRTSPYPGQDEIRGPYFDEWIAWRAGIIHDWLKRAAGAVRTARPSAQVAVYVGSWYGDYYKVGSNWAGSDFAPDGSHLSPEYMRNGYANLLDWLTTGCYYVPSTISEAIASGNGPGVSVEAAGQLSNRVVNDNAWTYAGLYALSYHGNPDRFSHAISAALMSTQGVMIFDMSQIVEYNWWDTIHDALAGVTSPPPNIQTELSNTLKQEHTDAVQRGDKQPYLPAYSGVSGTGL